MRWLIACAFAGLIVAAAMTSVALASSSGTVSETISVGVRSLTVSPTSVALCTTGNPLTFPNGQCTSPNITITNGQAGGDHIDVQGANAVPSDVSPDPGKSPPDWALCNPRGAQSAASTCSGTNAFPGADQYSQLTETTSLLPETNGVFLANTPTCDFAFGTTSNNSDCVAAAGQAIGETLLIDGPSSSTDQSPTFSSVVTWTAAP